MDAPTQPSATLPAAPAWKLDWLTPLRCRLILGLVLVLGFLGHVNYLTRNCPIDLSGDEAYYWDWSRKIDLCYFSKPPMVAYLIRASCAIFGDTMPAVRYPALALAIGTSLLTYWLTRKLFASDRLALGAVLLSHVVPMFIAGSVMMTIDPPLFFFWAAATCLAAKAIFDDSKPAWIGLGIALGLGFLSKFSMPLWLIGLFLFLLIDRDARKYLFSRWLWIALGIGAIFSIPILIWNHQHGWVSSHHVARDTSGAGNSGFSPLNILEFVGSQVAALGPPLAVILIGAVLSVFRPSNFAQDTTASRSSRGARFLLLMGLPYFLLVTATSFWAKVQANWPAPAYFSLMILAAWFLSTRLANQAVWKRWRGWFWGAVILGLVCIPLIHNTEFLYRPVYRLGLMFKSDKPDKPGRKNRDRDWVPQKWDLTFRLRGWRELGQALSKNLRTLGPDAIVLGERYEYAGEAAFYTQGQPQTYYIGSWFTEPKFAGRQSQYDMWDDRRLDRPELLGRDAIYIGHADDDGSPPKELMAAFERIEARQTVLVERNGIKVRAFNIWRCHGFKGMKHPKVHKF